MLPFSPSEADKITGVTDELQRNWRRRGYLKPKARTRVTYNLFDLCEMMALDRLAARGTGPRLSLPLAKLCGIGVAWHALRRPSAYEGQLHLVGSWDPEWFAGIKLPDRADHQAQSIRDGIFRANKIGAVPMRFFVWWADGSHEWYSNLDFGPAAQDPRVAGAVMFLDIEALALWIGANAGRAFVHVELTASTAPDAAFPKRSRNK